MSQTDKESILLGRAFYSALASQPAGHWFRSSAVEFIHAVLAELKEEMSHKKEQSDEDIHTEQR